MLCGVAGASGGHIIPGVIYMQSEAHKEGAQVLFFSTNTRFDQSILGHYSTHFIHCSLPVIPVPGKKVWRYPIFAYRALQAFMISLRALRRYRVERVVSMGGFISVPVCLAARFLQIPVHLYELNAVPGKAVRWLAPIAQTILVCFPEAAIFFDSRKVHRVDYPLRFGVGDTMSREAARAHFGITSSKKIVLVLGGSQGSQALNRLVKRFFEKNVLTDSAVIHQTGSTQGDPKKEFDHFYKEQGVEAVVFAYTHELNIAYEAADLVISRAGAGSLFELLFFQKKSIIIPLEASAEAHQLENALSMCARYPKLFTLVRQTDAERNPALLYDLIRNALNHF
jgi:UDP-N-acetylglucosamine--N-acetylmuramyl-(pentapeptide) pyrophosphoryl-undecaprenol N-acetylglucosamine transferase